MIQITAPHFCAGLVHSAGLVTKAAPILRYMLGWDGRRVADYCRRKGWTWTTVPEPPGQLVRVRPDKPK